MVTLTLILCSLALVALLSLKDKQYRRLKIDMDNRLREFHRIKGTWTKRGDVIAYWDIKLRKGETKHVKELREALNVKKRQDEDDKLVQTIKVSKFCGESVENMMVNILVFYGLVGGAEVGSPRREALAKFIDSISLNQVENE